MGSFENVSILIPTLNETFSFVKTIEIIIQECDPKDIREFIAVVCDRTTKESLESIEQGRALADAAGIPFDLLYQTRPFAGGAYQDGIDAAKGSHTLIMSADLETDPHDVKVFIESGKKFPDDMTTASRWLNKGSFKGYNKLKFVLNFIFQKFFSAFYHVKLTDITYGYRLAPTSLFQAIKWEELKHPFFLETALKPIKLGVKVHEIPSGWVARLEGESQNSLLATFKYLRIAFKVKFEKRSQLLKDPDKNPIV